MFTFCDVLHETKQNRKQTLERAQYGLEISFTFLPHRVLPKTRGGINTTHAYKKVTIY